MQALAIRETFGGLKLSLSKVECVDMGGGMGGTFGLEVLSGRSSGRGHK